MFHPTAKPWANTDNRHRHRSPFQQSTPSPAPTSTIEIVTAPAINRWAHHGGSPPQRPAAQLVETLFSPRLRRGSNHHAPSRPACAVEQRQLVFHPTAKPWANTDNRHRHRSPFQQSTPSPAPTSTIEIVTRAAINRWANHGGSPPQRPAVRLVETLFPAPPGDRSPRAPSRPACAVGQRQLVLHPTAKPWANTDNRHRHRSPFQQSTPSPAPTSTIEIVTAPAINRWAHHGGSPPQRPAARLVETLFSPRLRRGIESPRAVTPRPCGRATPTRVSSARQSRGLTPTIDTVTGPHSNNRHRHRPPPQQSKSSPRPPSTAYPPTAVRPHNAPPLGWSKHCLAPGSAGGSKPPRAVTPCPFGRATPTRVSSHGKAVG